jgi:hypothetical protein
MALSKQAAVQPNLSGTRAPTPRGCLYVDESRAPGWLYIGVLAVPDRDAGALLAALQEDRIAVRRYRELRFSQITTATKAALGAKWLDRALAPGPPLVRFHILGNDLANLNWSAFGEGRRARREDVYRRFLTMALDFASRSYLPERAWVRAIVHDHRTVAANEDFEWRTPRQMRRRGLRIATDSVALIDSDHEVSESEMESSFIQLIDVILGATRLCLDATNGKPHPARAGAAVASPRRTPHG